jgi:hypothetical protein
LIQPARHDAPNTKSRRVFLDPVTTILNSSASHVLEVTCFAEYLLDNLLINMLFQLVSACGLVVVPEGTVAVDLSLPRAAALL